MCLVVQLCLTLCDPIDCSTRLLCPWDFPGKSSGVGCRTGTKNRHGPGRQGELTFVLLHLGVPVSSLCGEKSLPTRFVAQL